MSRMTLRLPETLHRALEAHATREGVSLNQYIVFALSRQTTIDYVTLPVSEHPVYEQRARYSALVGGLHKGSPQEVEAALAARDVASPESDLTPETINKLKGHLKRKTRKTNA